MPEDDRISSKFSTANSEPSSNASDSKTLTYLLISGALLWTLGIFFTGININALNQTSPPLNMGSRFMTYGFLAITAVGLVIHAAFTLRYLYRVLSK